MGRERQLLRVGSVTPSSTLTPTHIRQLSDTISVLTAATIDEAIAVLDSQLVDCVICEPTPEHSGLEWIGQLRDHYPGLPVFLVVADSDESTIAAAIDAGVTDCVVAPYSEVDRRLLANRLQTAIDTSRSQPSAVDRRRDQPQTAADSQSPAAANSRPPAADSRPPAADSQSPAAANSRPPAADSRPPAADSRPQPDSDSLPRKADYCSLVEDVLGGSYIGTFVLDKEFSVVWINDCIKRYFGVDSEIIGQDKRTLIEDRIKHRFADPERFAKRVIATYDDNTYVEQFECHVIPDSDCEDRWLEHWSYPITTGPYEGGRIEHYVDITARKQREWELESERQLLDRLFETSPTGIVLLDCDGEITRANSHGEVVLGLSKSELTDRSYDDPNWEIHDDGGSPIPSEELPFAVVKRTGEPVFGYEHGIRLDDGIDRWLSVSASPLTAPDGSVDRVVCVVVDVTTTRNAELKLDAHNQQLEEFASIVSHDLRNPLNVLAGSLELAEETAESAHFERSQRALDRMNQLIDDLLLLARAGRTIDATEPVDIGELAAACWQNLSAERACLNVETDLVVVADKSRLTQLFENLFRNSVEHGSTNSRSQTDDNSIEHGGDDVTITVGALSDGFFVADNGPGIPPAYREHLFERGVSSTREGTGLGLYIVDQIADAHGWRVGLADSNTGTRIEITGVIP